MSLTPAVNFSPVSLTPLNSLSPVTMTPAININSRISPQIFEKMQNGPNGILGGLGTLIHEKNLKLKISCQTPFNEPAIYILYVIYNQSILNIAKHTPMKLTEQYTHLTFLELNIHVKSSKHIFHVANARMQICTCFTYFEKKFLRQFFNGKWCQNGI